MIDKETATGFSCERPIWVMPDWMEKYRYAIESYCGGRTTEELMNNNTQNLWNNAPGAAFCIACSTVTAVLKKLHADGLV